MLIVIKKLRDLKHNIINLENTERKIQKEKELF